MIDLKGGREERQAKALLHHVLCIKTIYYPIIAKHLTSLL